jgi:hypothetical protein
MFTQLPFIHPTPHCIYYSRWSESAERFSGPSVNQDQFFKKAQYIPTYSTRIFAVWLEFLIAIKDRYASSFRQFHLRTRLISTAASTYLAPEKLWKKKKTPHSGRERSIE